MSGTVNIGTLEGVIAVKNAYSAEFTRFDKEVKDKLLGSIKGFSDANQKETTRIRKEYDKVNAALDPLAANTLKYQRAEQSLTAALKAGIITQDQHTKSLHLAKEKYLGINASTLTWREEIQRLTDVITPFSGKLTNLTGILTNISSSLGLTASSTKAVATETVTATAITGASTTAFASLGAVLLPLAPLLASLAVAFSGVYLAAKSFTFLKDGVSQGVETQLIIERLDNSLRSTGSYAQVSSAQLVQLAESYELLTGKQKEEIIAAELVLSRFETLNSKTYPEALNVVLAYSRSLGVTAEEASKRLGPALEGNTRSLVALKEAGVVLTSQQRKTLTEMVEQGKVAEYQSLVFGILKEKVGELSTEYDVNLSRQADRAKVIIEDFGESIANQVIPAIEDLVASIINSLGGWDRLKIKVNEVGSAIGKFISTAIYGLRIAFHELGGVIDSLVANFAMLRSFVTTDVASWKKWRDISAEATSSGVEHALAISRITQELATHKPALEGNTEVYRSHGSAINDIVGKNSQLEATLESLNEHYAEQTLKLEKIYALRMLAVGGPGSLTETDRIHGEERINEEYEYRVNLLKQQAKYGEIIGKQLADQERDLKELERQARIEISLAMKLEPIDLSPTLKKLFDQTTANLNNELKLREEIATVEQKNQDEYKKSQAAYEEFFQSVANDWKESFQGAREVADREIDIIRTAVQEGFLSIAEGERAISEVRYQYMSIQLNQWTGFLSYLGNQFGGFFQRIAQLAQSVQSGMQMGSQIGGQISGIGAAAGGMAGGIIAVVIEVYKWMKSEAEKRKQESYQYGAVLSKGGEGWSSPQMGDTRRASMQIKDTIEALAEAIGGVFDTFAALEIQVRRDGKYFHAFVEGVLVGSFKDMQSAVEATILKALKSPSTTLSGISDLIREGLEYALSDGVVKVGTLDELQDFLGKLKTISDMSLSPAIVGLQSTMREFNRLREVLNKLDQSSQTVIDSQNDLTRAQIKAVNDMIDGMLGIDRAANKALDDLLAFQKGLPQVADSFTSGLMESIKAAQRRLNELNNPPLGSREGGGGGGGTGSGGGTYDQGGGLLLLSDTTDEINAEKIRLQKAIDEWTAQLGEVPKALTTQQLDLGIFTALEPFINNMKDVPKYAEMAAKFERMRLKAVFGELKLQIIALGRWEEWAITWQELYNNAIQVTQGASNLKPGKLSGGGSNRDSIRDFIKDTKFELSLTGLTDYQKALKELDKQYDDLLKQAGKDKKLKQELLDLKEKELKQLQKEQASNIRDRFREFMGLVTPFDKIRKTAADLIKDIKGSPLGDAEKANKISRVLEEVNKQVTQLSKEMARSLFGEMLSDMERFGATDEQMRQARIQLAILEHGLKMAHYAAELAILEAEAKLAPEVMAALHAAYDFLAGIDPTKFILPPVANDNFDRGMASYSGGGEVYTYQDYADLLGRIREQIAEWNRVPLSETLQAAHEISDSYAAMLADIERLRDINPLNPELITLTAQAQAAYQNLVQGFIDDTLSEFEDVTDGLQGELEAIGERFTDINAAFIHLGASQEDLARLEVARLNAVRMALEQYLEPIREFRRNMQMNRETSTLTGEGRFLEAQRRFRELYSQIQSGDLTNLGEATSLAQQYAELLRQYTGGEGLRFGLSEIDSTLASIEQLVPGFANQMAEIGTEANPMYVLDANSSRPEEAIRESMEESILAMNTGNSLLLAEMRDSNLQAREQVRKLNDIRGSLSERPYIPVRMIA